MSFSVIIPVYNEEKIIESNTKKLIKFLNRLKTRYEIIIADNGSNDKTAEIAKMLEKKYPRVKLISVAKKGAVGWAFRNAVLSARYENIISLDMDLSIDLNFVSACLKMLKENSIVVGSKLTGSQQRSVLRRFASFVFIFMTRVLLNLRFNDYSIAAKGYRRKDIIKYVKKVDKGSAYVFELLYSAKKRRLKMCEIPTYCFDKRRSKFSFIDEVLYRFRSLLTLWLRNML